MSGRRIKNLILLILALAVCFLLLAVVPGKLSAQREESALHRGLTELLASYGVSIDPALLTPGETLYAIELGEADASAAAASWFINGAATALRLYRLCAENSCLRAMRRRAARLYLSFPENNQKSLKNYRKQTSACGKMGAAMKKEDHGRDSASGEV